MVAKIKVSKNIGKALNYNEQKVQKGQAECIHAEKFPLEKNAMSFHDKLDWFNDLIQRNKRAKSNSLHISLNFDPSEKLSVKSLIDITKTYMDKIGFGDQPYLVYQHHDAAHPHVHIVTTNIKKDGSRINTHNIGRRLSETARKEIEKQFGLVVAGRKNFREINHIPAVDAQKVAYGKSETKRAITNVLDAVIKRYKYTSLYELNAVLQQYNVLADRGQENSQTFKNGGLLYRVINKQGNKVGVPIKASSIYSKPTLKNIEKRFWENEEKRKEHAASVKERIDQALEVPWKSQAFLDTLRKRGIDVVLKQNDEGIPNGITFVDHKTKCVFSGNDLGQGYTVPAIVERMKQSIEKSSKAFAPTLSKSQEMDLSKEKSTEQASSKSLDILNELLKAEKGIAHVPYELLKKKQKKKKRNLGL